MHIVQHYYVMDLENFEQRKVATGVKRPFRIVFEEESADPQVA